MSLLVSSGENIEKKTLTWIRSCGINNSLSSVKKIRPSAAEVFIIVTGSVRAPRQTVLLSEQSSQQPC
ncbi:hypothetical protein PAMP_024059 [Pampus punctatissimus]